MTRRAFFGRTAGADELTVTTADHQRITLRTLDLLDVGYLRQAQLLGHLRSHLSRITVDSLTSRHDQIVAHLAQRARQSVRRSQSIRTRKLAVGKQITAIGTAEHRLTDDVGGAERAHGQNMHRRPGTLLLQAQCQLEGIQIFGVENGRQRRTIHRTFGSHGILTHIAGIGHLLGQNNDFQCFVHRL